MEGRGLRGEEWALELRDLEGLETLEVPQGEQDTVVGREPGPLEQRSGAHPAPCCVVLGMALNLAEPQLPRG